MTVRDFLYVTGPCQHVWEFHGGCNAGCDDDCSCSIPVHRCKLCGDFDYGNNDDALEIMRVCEEQRRDDPRE